MEEGRRAPGPTMPARSRRAHRIRPKPFLPPRQTRQCKTRPTPSKEARVSIGASSITCHDSPAGQAASPTKRPMKTYAFRALGRRGLSLRCKQADPPSREPCPARRPKSMIVLRRSPVKQAGSSSVGSPVSTSSGVGSAAGRLVSRQPPESACLVGDVQ